MRFSQELSIGGIHLANDHVFDMKPMRSRGLQPLTAQPFTHKLDFRCSGSLEMLSGS